MGINELNREQLMQVKANMLCQRNAEIGKGTSYYELLEADRIISDEEARREYRGYIFSPDDFF